MDIIKLFDKEFSMSINPSQIQKAVADIAGRINIDLEGENPIFISVLNGSFMFTADLMKKVNLNCQVSFLKLSSYHGSESTGKVTELIGLSEDIRGRTVVIIEDIVDTGTTLGALIAQLEKHKPKKIKVATLLLKPGAFSGDIHLDYVGIEIPDDFIVGYGLDYNQQGRNLEGIYKIV